MKLSVSLPEQDVQFLDEVARRTGVGTRSAVLRQAIRLLRGADLGASYAEAWGEWEATGDSEIWEPTAGDGLWPKDDG